MTITSKLNYILTKNDKKRLIIIIFLNLISALFDLIGISAILPIVSLLTSNGSDVGGLYGYIIDIIFDIFGNLSKGKLVMVLAFLLSTFYLVKAFYTMFLLYIVTKFNMSFKRRTSSRMIKAYLSMPYEFHLQHNSSTLLRSATYDSDLFVGAMNSVIQLVLKISTIVILTGYLIYNDIVGKQFTTLIVGGTVLLSSFFIVVLLKKHIKRVSIVIQRLSGDNYKLISQAFNGIKESKISNSELFFSDCYEKNILAINRYQIRNTIYNNFPYILLETLGLISLLGALVLSVFLKDEQDYPSIVASFSVLALATIKLLPAIVSASTNFNSLTYTKASVDLLYNDIRKAEENESYLSMNKAVVEPLVFFQSIDIKNVSFKYSGNDRVVLNDVSFSIKKGESIAISGNSGEGKTTMVDLILGLLNPTKGDIVCDGESIFNNIRGWHTNLSYIPQNIYLMDDTIRNNIAFGIDKKNIEDYKIWQALHDAQLDTFVKSLPDGLDTIIGERGIRMSGGQRQRIGIARAFYRNTQIIVFDEATSALDYETEKKVLLEINKFRKSRTIIIITHRLNTIESCDHIFKVDKG